MLRALQYGKSIRILKQDPWEMLISFIVSQNNNIPRIKKIIQALCENFGTEIISENERNFTFPAPVQLERATQNELKQIGLGYRDGYIMDAISKISWGEIDLDRIQKSDTGQARSELMKIKGVGGKVADCILLFGLSRYEACPHDVWVKRIFSEKYRIEKINEKKGYEFAQKKWGAYAGIAQQYLFYYEREHYKSKN
jgi:N-glycosylase/DNA lyase